MALGRRGAPPAGARRRNRYAAGVGRLSGRPRSRPTVVRHDTVNDYAIVRRGAIELHFTASPDLDPWTSAGMAFVRLDDVSALYEEFVATGALPLVPGPRSELQPAERQRDELRAKWENGESIARMGELADKPWGIREFALLDPSNNLIRFGQAIG